MHADVGTLEHPDRLVFDFNGSELAHPAQRLVGNRGSVIAVRTAVFSSVPAIARLVIDLGSPLDHEEAYVGNTLVIKLHLTGGPQLPVPASGVRNLDLGSQPSRSRTDRTRLNSSNDSQPAASAQVPLESGGRAAVQLSAYVLLARARALSVADLELLEASPKAGDLESETMLALAYHAGTLLKHDDAEALRLLRLEYIKARLVAASFDPCCAAAEGEVDEWRSGHLPRQPDH